MSGETTSIDPAKAEEMMLSILNEPHTHQLSSTPALTKDDLDMLTEPELQVLRDLAEEDAPAEEATPTDDDTKAPKDDTKAAEPDPVPTPDPEPVATPDPTPQPAPAPAPVADLSKQIDELKTDMTGVDEKIAKVREDYANADIDDAEAQKRLDELIAEKTGLASQLGAIEGAAAVQKATQEAMEQAEATARKEAWNADARTFLAKHSDLAAKEHFTGFNETVQALSSTSYGKQLDNASLLNIAAQNYVATCQQAGLEVPNYTAPKAPNTQSKETPKDLPDKPKRSEKPEAPQTLQDVPGDISNPNQTQIAVWADQIENADPDTQDLLWAMIPEHLHEEVLQYNDE